MEVVSAFSTVDVLKADDSITICGKCGDRAIMSIRSAMEVP